jgi:hypothetical protein
MSTATLYRLSGAALLLGLPIQVASLILHPPGHELTHILDSWWVIAHVALLVSWVLAILGLFGMYGRQTMHAGVLGLIGFVLTFLGGLANIYFYFYHAFVAPVLAQHEQSQMLIAPGGTLAERRQGMLPALLVVGILLTSAIDNPALRTLVTHVSGIFIGAGFVELALHFFGARYIAQLTSSHVLRVMHLPVEAFYETRHTLPDLADELETASEVWLAWPIGSIQGASGFGTLNIPAATAYLWIAIGFMYGLRGRKAAA